MLCRTLLRHVSWTVLNTGMIPAVKCQTVGHRLYYTLCHTSRDIIEAHKMAGLVGRAVAPRAQPEQVGITELYCNKHWKLWTKVQGQRTQNEGRRRPDVSAGCREAR